MATYEHGEVHHGAWKEQEHLERVFYQSGVRLSKRVCICYECDELGGWPT